MLVLLRVYSHRYSWVLTFNLNKKRQTMGLSHDIRNRACVFAGVRERELPDGQRFGGQQNPGAHVVLQSFVLRGHKNPRQ